MRCNICDKVIQENEIDWNKETKEYEPCVTCLEIALDAAYSGDFSPDEEPLEGESEFSFIAPSPILDVDTYRSYYDHCDTCQGSRFSENE